MTQKKRTVLVLLLLIGSVFTDPNKSNAELCTWEVSVKNDVTSEVKYFRPGKSFVPLPLHEWDKSVKVICAVSEIYHDNSDGSGESDVIWTRCGHVEQVQPILFQAQAVARSPKRPIAGKGRSVLAAPSMLQLYSEGGDPRITIVVSCKEGMVFVRKR